VDFDNFLEGGGSMAQLTKGMYGQQFQRVSKVFGLSCGQIRSRPDKTTHNSGWYNKLGEKLGWGDLDVDDFRRISSELENGEFFIILGEQDSYWRLHETGRAHLEEAPGVDYVAEHAMFIITQGQLYFVNDSGFREEETKDMYSLQFKVLNGHDAVKQLMKGVY